MFLFCSILSATLPADRNEEGSHLELIDFVSLNSRLESKKEAEKKTPITET
jgi:hypothetical protein